MSDFTRPKEGFRFRFGGMKLGVPADAIPYGKYAMAVNVRAFDEDTIQTRPGLNRLFTTGVPNGIVTDFRAYTALGIDDLPRFLTRNADDSIWLDSGIQQGSLLGGGASAGATLIPFRPGATPQPYMYIANGFDYQKFSAPFTLPVIKQNVGIAEPQTPPDASISNILQNNLLGTTYTQGGTAGAPAGSTRFSDTVGAAVLKDPVSGSGTTSNYPVYSLQVSTTASYQKYAELQIGLFAAVVLDVFPTMSTASLALTGIFYFVGNTGHCVLVVSSLQGQGTGDSINDPIFLTSLRRGAILKVGTESILVWSVTPGPDNTYSIETSTVSTHTTTDTVTIIPAIKVMQMQQGAFAPATGNAIGDQKTAQAYQVTVGVGTETSAAIVTMPFVGGPVISTSSPYQPDDYISFGFKIDVPTNLTEMKLLFDVDDGSFTKNFYYYTVRATDLAGALSNAFTQLAIAQTVTQRALIDEENAIAEGNQGVTFSGAQGPTGVNTWIQIFFPISELTRVGTDQTKSLLTLTKFQVLWNVTGTINVVQDNSFFVWGGFDPDVGDVGAPYLYRVAPYSSTTGVIGNPSPASRYGVNPQRQAVLVTLPSAAYDLQIDTWYVYRYGGSVTEWRFIASVPSSTSTFVDNFSDEAAGAGDELEFDNFEPWPTIDSPVVLTTAVATVVGTTAVTTFNPTPQANRYLPGTLVRIGLTNVFTLWNRPIALGGQNFLLQFVENAGAPAGNQEVTIQEPIMARQFLPYMWGPDANGVVFACGDPLRAGTLYFAKPFAPDSAPDKYNQEITPPSEPLVGGEIIDGVPYAASPERWWRLYFQPDNPAQRYSAVQEPIERGLAAPFGHCTDGKDIYFWAKDGIYGIQKGSLTDADLYRVFPHEGVKGEDQSYNGVTVHAPDYSRVKTFRLTHSNGYLYAIYQDSGGIYRTLTLDLKRMAWISDDYSASGQVTAAYHTEQQSSSSGVLNPVTLFAKTLSGATTQSGVFVQTPLHNDDTIPIVPVLATHEYDGGDLRAPVQWGDIFADLTPAATPSGVLISQMSLGLVVGTLVTVPTGGRIRTPASVGGIVVSDFMGLFITWSDDFTHQTVATRLIAWQPSFDIQPARIIGLSTFGSSYGLQGYGHIRQIAVAWVSTQPVILTISTVDGESPVPINIPSSGGVYNKQMFPVAANKGQLFLYRLSSTANFQVFEDDCEVHVGAWSRSAPYQVFKGLGGINVAESPI